MEEFIVLLQAKLDEAKSVNNLNGSSGDIAELQKKLNALKLQVTLDPEAAQKLADDIGKLTNQKIVISNIGIDTKSGAKAGQEYGKQFTQNILQEISSVSKPAEKVLRDFSQLNDAKRKFVDGHDLISKEDITDAERLYDTVRKYFSEFGQVTVNRGSMNDGSLENMRVKIEQVNGEMKITRDFMLYFNESKNGFRLVDDDTIRTTEKMIQHLNEEKNIVNATNEEANAIKAKLAEQEKHYNNIKKEVSDLYSLKTKLLSADELQTAELKKQIKQTKERISYNSKQLDKKDLRDSSLDRQINDLEVAKQKQLDLASAKLQDAINTKELAQAEKEAMAALKERQSIEDHAKRIQLSMTGQGNVDYNWQVDNEIKKLRNLGYTEEEVAQKARILTDAHADLNRTIHSNDFDSVEAKNKAIIESDEQRAIALNQVKNAYRELKTDTSQYYNLPKQEKLTNNIQNWLYRNSGAARDAKQSLNEYYRELSSGRVSVDRLDYIQRELNNIDTAQRSLGKLGKSIKDQFSEAYKNFTQWLSVSSAVMLGISKANEAVTELIELDSILTEISKTSNLTNKQLKELGNNAFDSASKYGRSAADYLTGVQEMYRAGFGNAEEMAKLSLMAQAAGDMASNSANDYLMATNAAYNYKGNVEELNKVLDSQNHITNNAAVSMQDMADATSEAASIAAQYGVGIDELSALIAVATSKTRESGSEVGNALKSIFVTLQDTTSKPVIDAFNSVGISMTKIVNGAERLKTPIELLKELSDAFIDLPEGDTKRANILTDIGKKYHANTLSAILSDWASYESMLTLYSQGMGSAAEEAEKSANNIEGSLNRLGNTWTDTIQNIISSDAMLSITKLFNGVLSVINNITTQLGSLGTIGLGTGLLAGVKNVGRDKMYSLICYLF